MSSLATLLAAALAADPSIPHIHNGALEPFKAGQPPKPSGSEEALLNAGKTVMKSVKLPGQGGRAMAIFDVPAPPEIVWDCINDIKSYPKMVSGVADVSIYDGPRTSGGVTRTRAKWTLSFIGYKVTYFNEMLFEPRYNSMTFRLDYTRNSDLDDTVGKWHVAPIVGPDGAAHSRVSYSAALTLRMWLPKTVVDMLFSSTLGQATSWVAPEAKKRLAAAGGAASAAGGGAAATGSSKSCKWSLKGRRCTSSTPPPPPPPPPPSDLRMMMDTAMMAVAIAFVLFLVGKSVLG